MLLLVTLRYSKEVTVFSTLFCEYKNLTNFDPVKKKLYNRTDINPHPVRYKPAIAVKIPNVFHLKLNNQQPVKILWTLLDLPQFGHFSLHLSNIGFADYSRSKRTPTISIFQFSLNQKKNHSKWKILHLAGSFSGLITLSFECACLKGFVTYITIFPIK